MTLTLQPKVLFWVRERTFDHDHKSGVAMIKKDQKSQTISQTISSSYPLHTLTFTQAGPLNPMQLVQTVTTSTLLGEIDSLASLGRPTRYVDDPEPGARRFDYKFVNLVKPSAICSICHHVMVRAVSMCPGGHLGCEECLTKHCE